LILRKILITSVLFSKIAKGAISEKRMPAGGRSMGKPTQKSTKRHSLSKIVL
jgi:hypothetical protein